MDAPVEPAADTEGKTAPSIMARTAAGTGWIVAWRMATRVLGLVSTLVLVRILAPADFGLVALANSMIAAVDTLTTLGIEDALVREHKPTPLMYDTAFTMTALRSLATTLVIAAGALPIAAFFLEPRLATILWALAIGTLIQGAGSIGVVDFRRNIAFEKEFLLQILPRFSSIVVTIGVALIWHSYWALIAGILTGRVLRTLFSYRMHSWRPTFTLAAWRDLIGFSVWSWAITMASLVRDRVDMFVVGRVISSTAVGVYSIGDEIAFLPATEVVLPLCRACFSAFSVARREGHSIQDAFIRPVTATLLVTFPAGLGISLVADPMVRLIMGDKWTDAIPVIQLLGIMGATTVFGLVAGTLLSSQAMLRQLFSITLVCLLIRLVILVVLVNQFGFIGAACGAFAGMIVEHAMMLTLTFRRFDISVAELVKQIWRIIAAGLMMVIVLPLAGLGWTETLANGPELTLYLSEAVVLGAAVYSGTLFGLWYVSGKPRGAEVDMLSVAIRLIRRVTEPLMTQASRLGLPFR